MKHSESNERGSIALFKMPLKESVSRVIHILAGDRFMRFHLCRLVPPGTATPEDRAWASVLIDAKDTSVIDGD
jgi:hypothetical protein